MTNDHAGAIIGLGRMGAGMAQNLLRQGFELRGYDLDSTAAERFTGAGGRFRASPAEAAEGAPLLMLVVLNAPQVEDVLFAGGALDALAPGAVVICCSTVPPAVAVELERRVVASGRLYLDAPVTGGVQGADAGTLTVLASGSNEAFDAAGPALQAVAAVVHQLGDRAGAGSTAKLVNQLLVGTHLAVAAEAVELCRRLEVDTDVLFEVIRAGMASSHMFNFRAPQLLAGDFSLEQATGVFVKDLGAVRAVADDLGLALPVGRAAERIFRAAAGHQP
ncbi:MAG: NAD(P)-dependent oxidoreductase [Geminicoccaceae bacterium]|nr:NAD(P)-dependent oxidoreductase [Geminicoccaceae bacterium]